MTALSEATAIGPEVTNGAQSIIETSFPYIASATITGVAELLFHRWNVEGVEAKGKAAKGSKAKKTDDLESYVWRDDDGTLSLPGEYVRSPSFTPQSIAGTRGPHEKVRWTFTPPAFCH